MIKFFRRFRQRLISENKFSKYLLYAVGEIVLVVIGILIALSINNWNENRKLKAEENELLTNLSLSFERKLNELESKNIGRTKNINGIDKLLETLATKNKTISDDEMFVLMQDLFTWYAVNEEFSIIDMLYSSGKINMISNDSLKNKLISWPDYMEEMLEEQRVLQDLVVNNLNPLISEYVSSANLLNSFKQKNAPETIYNESPHPNDFNGLFNDRGFESLIAQKNMYLITNIEDTKILIVDAKIILQLISEELNK
jgi:hypothetical protein